MRSSSIKTLLFVITLAFTVVAAAPTALARPAQPKRATQTRKQTGVTDRVQIVARQLLQRFFGITANGLPGEPIPELGNETTGGVIGLPGDPVPTLPVK